MSEPTPNDWNRSRIIADIKRILIAETAKRDGQIDFDVMAEAIADHDFRPSVRLQGTHLY